MPEGNFLLKPRKSQRELAYPHICHLQCSTKQQDKPSTKDRAISSLLQSLKHFSASSCTQWAASVWLPHWPEAPLSWDREEMLPKGRPLSPLPESRDVQLGISGRSGSDQSSCGHRGGASSTIALFLQAEPKARLPGCITDGQLGALLWKGVPSKAALTEPTEHRVDTKKETEPTQAEFLFASSYFLPFQCISALAIYRLFY